MRLSVPYLLLALALCWSQTAGAQVTSSPVRRSLSSPPVPRQEDEALGQQAVDSLPSPGTVGSGTNQADPMPPQLFNPQQRQDLRVNTQPGNGRNYSPTPASPPAPTLLSPPGAMVPPPYDADSGVVDSGFAGAGLPNLDHQDFWIDPGAGLSAQPASPGKIGQDFFEGCSDCDRNRCIQYRWQLDYDALFLKYNKEGGTAVGNNVNPGDDLAEFDLGFSHRVTARFALDNKYYLVGRGFRFSENERTIQNPLSAVDLEMFYVDLMAGRRFCLPRQAQLDLEIGGRWSEFREQLTDSNDLVQFKESWAKQAGLVFGGDLTKKLLPGVSVFLNGYVSYSQVSYFRQSGAQNDSLDRDLHAYEAMAGIQVDRRLENGTNIFFRTGYAYFNWQNLGSSFDNGNDETYAGFRDMDLTGLSFRMGIRR